MLVDRLAKQIMRRWQRRLKTKHLQAVLRYSTSIKVVNAVKLWLHMARRDVEVRAYPLQLTLDTTSVCNLKCPLCPTGMGILDRTQSVMDFDLYRRIIDTLSPYLYMVNLFNFGEPLFNKRLPEYIAYARSKGVYTSISTNLTFLSEERAEALIRSGLDHLLLSIDGLSQDTYEQYRIGGDLTKVLANLHRLMATRKRLGSTSPMVEWQYLVFNHNKHEVPNVEAFARSHGVDAVYIRKGSGPQEWSVTSEDSHDWPSIKVLPLAGRAIFCTTTWSSTQTAEYRHAATSTAARMILALLWTLKPSWTCGTTRSIGKRAVISPRSKSSQIPLLRATSVGFSGDTWK